MTEYLNGKELPIAELRIGDTVEVFDGPYGSATVKKIKDGLIWFHRPYGHFDNVRYGDAVICYVGVEEFSRFQTDSSTVKVWRRETLA
jgi:hypothetical protein